jgi:hypothetical protein
MKIKDFINLWADGTHDDIDVYDDVCEELAIAYCGGYKLTKEGEKEFKEVLEYDILVDDDVAIVHVDDEEGIWQKKLKNAKRFFYAAAGYCDCDDYDRWFVEA